MKISHLRRQEQDGQVRIAADVNWEDCDRPAREVFFETSSDLGDALTLEPGAFLLAACVPAMYHGEQRITIEGSICPMLAEGIETNIRTLVRWYGAPRRVPKIEPTEGLHARRPAPQRAGLFLSGGIDSLFVLRQNRLRLPLDHPASFKDALYVYGIDMAGVEGRDRQPYFAAGRKALQPILDETGLELLPIKTNVKLLDDRFRFFQRESEGAILASIAHAFRNRISQITIAASDTVDTLGTYGTHPLIDPYYSDSALQIRHEGWLQNRIEKIAGILDWDAAMANLRVCFAYGYDPDSGQLNCGRCNKCIRTMLGLLVAGAKPENVPTLPMDQLTRQFVKQMKIRTRMDVRYVRNLAEALTRVGQDDLAGILRAKLRTHKVAATVFAFSDRYHTGRPKGRWFHAESRA